MKALIIIFLASLFISVFIVGIIFLLIILLLRIENRSKPGPYHLDSFGEIWFNDKKFTINGKWLKEDVDILNREYWKLKSLNNDIK